MDSRVAYGASSFLARYVTGLWSHKCADQRSRAVAANATASCLSLHSGHPSPTPDGSVNPCKGGAGRIEKSQKDAQRRVKSGTLAKNNRGEQRQNSESAAGVHWGACSGHHDALTGFRLILLKLNCFFLLPTTGRPFTTKNPARFPPGLPAQLWMMMLYIRITLLLSTYVEL